MGESLPEGIVTILFTDVEGSTALRNREGDETAQEALDVHDEIVRREVAGHAGHEVKALGDGFMVAFGSVVQAVSCAVAIQRALDMHNREHPEAAVRVRIGLNSGEVLRQGDDLQGVAVNAAARVAAKAKGGQIFISEVVRQLTAAIPGIRVQPRGRFQLKGFPERWRLYEVDWQEAPTPEGGKAQAATLAPTRQPARSEPGRFGGRGSEPDVRPVLCPVLIGRAAEVTVLQDALHEAGKSHGGLVLVLGEAGVGKSRLTREAVSLADQQGWIVLSGRAVPSPTPVAFRPLAEALLSALRVTGLPEGPELDPFRPALGRLVPQWRQASSPDAGESIVVLAEGVLRLLRCLADGRGCLLLLEDLHWADPETLTIVEYLADNLPSEPVMCLATMRTEETSNAIALARALRARRTGRVLELGRLGPTDVDHMAEACLGGSALPEEAAQALVAWAEGIPFFIEELLASWVSGGTLAPGPTGWSVAEKIEAAVPLTFADTIGRRLAALGQDAETVLQAAAIVGRRFDWTLLPMMTGHRDDTVLEVLRQATEAQLIGPDIEGAGFQFRHALTRDAIANTLLPPQRQALSRSALRVVETAHAGLPGDWCELAAELALEAGDAAAAGGLLLEAGQRALARGALSTGETILRRGRSLGGTDPSTADDIDEALCETLALAGKPEEAADVGSQLLERLQARAAPTSQRAKVHIRLARAAASAARWDVAENHLHASRELSPRGEDPALDSQRAGLAAQVAIGREDVALARRLAEEALTEAESARQPAQVCEALEVLGRCHRRSDLDAAEAALDKVRAVAANHGLTLWHIRATHELGGVDLVRGRSIDRLDDAARLAREAGALATAAAVELHRAFWFFEHYRLDEALAAARQCADSATRFHMRTVAGFAYMPQVCVHALRGRVDEVERALDTAASLVGPDALTRAPWADGTWFVRALLSLRNDDRDRAQEELDRAEDLSQGGGSPAPYRGQWALLHTLSDDDGGAEARARIRASAAAPHFLVRALLDYAEAIAAGRVGEHVQADALVKTADDAMHSSPWFHHHTRRLVAETALNDGWGDPLIWLREALAFFEAEGQEPLARACRSLLSRFGDQSARRRRPPTGLPEELAAFGITRRELDVLELLADGLATREIAARLYLSPKTVERHIANLADKTGVAGRAQLVAFAARLAIRQSH